MAPPRAPLILLLACAAIIAVTRPAGSIRPARELLQSPACDSACSNVMRTASPFFVLAGKSATGFGFNLAYDPLTVGVSPGTAITGFPTSAFTLHANDAVAKAAQADAKKAYNTLKAMKSPIGHIGALLGATGPQSSVVMKPGVYDVDSSAQGGGSFNLDGQGDPTSIFVFKFTGSLSTAVGFTTYLINGALACNVFYVVGGSVTLSLGTYYGTILAAGSITLSPRVTYQGSLVALGGSVSMKSTTTGGPCVKYPSPPPPAAPCNGYTFMMNVDSYGASITQNVAGGPAAAAACTSNAKCQSFDTDYRGVSYLRASSAYKSNNAGNAPTGLFTKTCDTATSGYAAIIGWDWSGTTVHYYDYFCPSLDCCKSFCTQNSKCDVFVFNSAQSSCKWEARPSTLLAGKKVASTIVSYMKLTSLPVGQIIF